MQHLFPNFFSHLGGNGSGSSGGGFPGGGGQPYAPPVPSSMEPMVEGLCFCCGTRLKYPPTVACFNCTVCQTINDLVPNQTVHLRAESREPLTKHKLSLFMNSLENGVMNPQTFREIIGDVFSNWELLNLSFANGESVTMTNPGVSLDDVREAYQTLVQYADTKDPALVQTLSTAIESLLKRPGRKCTAAADIRFLLILLENPLLSHASHNKVPTNHHELLARIFGILGNLSNSIHHYIVSWMSLGQFYPNPMLQSKIELVNNFLSGKLTANNQELMVRYNHSWAIRVGARSMALLFSSNYRRPLFYHNTIAALSAKATRLPLHIFYNALVDYTDLYADYYRWQDDSSAFTFCQYPFLISLGGKMQILEHDAKRQMSEKFKDAFLQTVYGHATDPFLSIHVRRDHLVRDSLKELSRPGVDFKKRLKVSFANEDGVDAGGLTKEWFLLLVRELFDPQYGMWEFEEDSQLCWFSAMSKAIAGSSGHHTEYAEELKQSFYFVGIILGLAIYNGTILDVRFPIAMYKKILSVAVTMEDFQQFKPTVAANLQKLLEYPVNEDSEGFEAAFGDMTFSIEVADPFEGSIRELELVPDGKTMNVTAENRQAYVTAYMEYVMNVSVSKPFESFKSGFMKVIGGNSIGLFRAEEIEMMVRGGTELDLKGLQSVTVYEGFDETDTMVVWLWEIVHGWSPELKQKFLLFVTGSDRIPATGIESMNFKVSCLEPNVVDSDNLPIAHTCFNQLCLYRYASADKLKRKLETAITYSAGFGLK